MTRKKIGKLNKFIKIGFTLLIFVLVILGVTNYRFEKTFAYEENDNGYGLQVDHQKAQGSDFFNITNMAPGEEYTEILTIRNVGVDRFQSYFSVVNTSSQGNLLFNYLDFSIREGSEDGAIIFDGKLKDLNNVVLCSLNINNYKNYYLTLVLPDDSGNEYQSKTASFKFVITADADTSQEGST